MTVPEFSSVSAMCANNLDKVIDLRMFAEQRPFTVFQKDTLQKIIDVFRLMNLRQLPVLDERRGSALTGIITRQDLFQFMKL